MNHASVLITSDRIGILSDPWYFGPAFHEGWSLLYENRGAEIDAVLGRTTHIWLSHEHPDHFSVPFFKKYGAVLRDRRIPVLFQTTKDQRVAGFLQANELDVIEIDDYATHDLGDGLRVKIIKSEFYDSALLLERNGFKVFNLNDCPLRSEADLARFRAVHGPCDVLLTQFSYAAWKGGRDNKTWRQEAAREKLETVALQARMLEAKSVIPFASFVRFSHALNDYLNDSVNRPADVAAALAGSGVAVVCLRPLERQSMDALRQDPESLKFWDEGYDALPQMPKTGYAGSISIDDLARAFEIYRTRTFANNSAWMIKLLGVLGLFGAFQPVALRLTDLDRTVTVDFVGGFRQTPAVGADIALHSASLDLIFKQDFGFDTLTVNGCFEERAPGGFQKMAKLFAIGNLNNMGIHLTPWIVLNVNLILMFLGRLKKVAAKLGA